MAHGKFEFQGTGRGFLWLFIWTAVLTVCTLGLFWPWAYCARLSWVAEHTFIDGKKLMFKGTGAGFFGTFLLVVILTVITLGIYIPWGYCRVKRWETNNLYFADEGDTENF